MISLKDYSIANTLTATVFDFIVVQQNNFIELVRDNKSQIRNSVVFGLFVSFVVGLFYFDFLGNVTVNFIWMMLTYKFITGLTSKLTKLEKELPNEIAIVEPIAEPITAPVDEPITKPEVLEQQETNFDLESMTIRELKKLSSQLGVKKYGRLKKHELVETLRKHMN